MEEYQKDLKRFSPRLREIIINKIEIFQIVKRHFEPHFEPDQNRFFGFWELTPAGAQAMMNLPTTVLDDYKFEHCCRTHCLSFKSPCENQDCRFPKKPEKLFQDLMVYYILRRFQQYTSNLEYDPNSWSELHQFLSQLDFFTLKDIEIICNRTSFLNTFLSVIWFLFTSRHYQYLKIFE